MLVRLLRGLHRSSVVIPQCRALNTSQVFYAQSNPVVDEQPSVPHFTFAEEPLGLPASEGFGYFQGGPGLILGPANRYKLQAKLGFGTASSVWLARDCM